MLWRLWWQHLSSKNLGFFFKNRHQIWKFKNYLITFLSQDFEANKGGVGPAGACHRSLGLGYRLTPAAASDSSEATRQWPEVSESATNSFSPALY